MFAFAVSEPPVCRWGAIRAGPGAPVRRRRTRRGRQAAPRTPFPKPGETRMKLLRPDRASDPVREKFARTRHELSAALIERDEEVDLVLTALVCHEHVLLVGPPGCGKSLLLDSLLAWTG